jgi:hypothetical protein
MKNKSTILISSFALQVTFLTLLGFFLLFGGCKSNSAAEQKGNLPEIQAANSLEIDRINTLLSIDLEEIQVQSEDVNLNNLIVMSGQKEIPSQLMDNKLFFVVDTVKASAKSVFTLQQVSEKQVYPKRTQAELSIKQGGHFENRKYIGGEFSNIDFLRVPPEHTDHSFFIRYEGPGWESDMVGYRFYLDWRNATDAFGKKTSDMVLQNVGLDGFDSYHELQPWGMDVLKVGKALGIGTLAIYLDSMAVRVENTDSVTCKVKENGTLYSAIETNYYGWKAGKDRFDVKSILSIHAGTRLTHHQVSINGQPDNLCTGIVKDKNARLFTDYGSHSQYGYIATYGIQSLNNDRLGLAVFFSNGDFKGFTEDEFSHIVKLDALDGNMDYYFLAAWELEKEGFNNEKDFMDYIKKVAVELANPVQVSISK